MPTNLSGRVALIIGVLYGALSLIYQWTPPSFVWLFLHTQDPISFKTALKPGIAGEKKMQLTQSPRTTS